jgi:hypothetical protein
LVGFSRKAAYSLFRFLPKKAGSAFFKRRLNASFTCIRVGITLIGKESLHHTLIHKQWLV